MITKLELIEYLKHTPENTNYNILYSSLYNGSNKEAVDEFIEVLSRGNLSLAALQPYLAKLYEDDKTISPDPLPPFSCGGGGSADAVLYTKQTLTEAQKKQARGNIDAAIADFVVNGTINSNMEVTLDKTFEQIQEAVQEGKHPAVNIQGQGMGATFLPLVAADTDMLVFAAVGDVSEGTITSIGLILTDNGSIFLDRSVSPVINSEGAMNQYPMESDPVSPMQIATKKYVDDKECILKSTTPGSTKKFKITVDDSGNISATEVT